jgi:hypothetical protein
MKKIKRKKVIFFFINFNILVTNFSYFLMFFKAKTVDKDASNEKESETTLKEQDEVESAPNKATAAKTNGSTQNDKKKKSEKSKKDKNIAKKLRKTAKNEIEGGEVKSPFKQSAQKVKNIKIRDKQKYFKKKKSSKK